MTQMCHEGEQRERVLQQQVCRAWEEGELRSIWRSGQQQEQIIMYQEQTWLTLQLCYHCYSVVILFYLLLARTRTKKRGTNAESVRAVRRCECRRKNEEREFVCFYVGALLRRVRFGNSTIDYITYQIAVESP